MKKLLSVILPVILMFFVGCAPSDIAKACGVGAENPQGPAAASSQSSTLGVEYKNDKYGFTLTLPESWKGYTVVKTTWRENGENPKICGPQILIRHPKWKGGSPRQDIPVMIFTVSQWKALVNDEFHIGSAPNNPTELARNSKYVFALPARYNYRFLPGYEEVEEIISRGSLRAFEV